MKVFLFLIAVALVQRISATLLAGNYVQLSCTGIEDNVCFKNPKSAKSRALTEMMESELYMKYEEGYGQLPETRKLQEESEQEQESGHLRGANRELQQSFCTDCASSGHVWICQMYCCPGFCNTNRRELTDTTTAEEPNVCEESFTLDTYLTDFPTKPLEDCLIGVDCVFEYLCVYDNLP